MAQNLPFAARRVANVAKATAVTELKGIRIAERRGVSRPAAAKDIPMILYMKEMMNPAITIRIAVLLKRIYFGRFTNLFESRIPSQAGEK